MSLTSRTIALAEGRQLEHLAQMLESDGATIVRCPMLSILDQPDDGPIVAWIRQLVDDKFELVVLLTGEGLRRLTGFAEREGIRDAFVEAMSRVKTITRGPKPVQALKEIGLAPYKIAAAPTTDGVIETLKQETLEGVIVGVQLYSADNPPLIEFLQAAGASMSAVSPYIYAPSADADDVVSLINRMAQGAIDCIVFTSSPQIDRLVEVAAEQKLNEVLKQGWQRVKIAAVGPVVRDKLIEIGARADIVPAQGFQMKNLVQHIKRALG